MKNEINKIYWIALDEGWLSVFLEAFLAHRMMLNS